MVQFYFIILVIAVGISQVALEEETVLGTLLYSKPRTTPRIARDSDDALQCPPGIMGPVCSSDCRTLLTCVSGALISSSKCADASSDYPYCVPNTLACSAEPDLSYETCQVSGPPTDEFSCTAQGYFPNPKDCTEFFVCTADAVYKYACPLNYVYNSKTSSCQLDGVCYTIDCTDFPNRFIAHPGNNAFYAFCSYSVGTTIVLMFRCDHAETHVFNPDKSGCEFRCRAEGWFSHETNPADYYECYYSEGVLVHRILSCPGNYIFDSETRICVPPPNCSVTCDGLVIE